MQYSKGTVTVTNGSPTVTGAGTSWLTNAVAGDLFTVRRSGVVYTILSVDSDTSITLNANFGQAGSAGLEYVISRSFTPNFRIPYPEPMDIDVIAIIKTALTLIDTLLRRALAPDVDLKTADYAVVAADDGKVIHMASPATQVTLPLASSVNTGFLVYVAGQTSMDVVRSGSDTIDGGTSAIAVTKPGRWFQKVASGDWRSY